MKSLLRLAIILFCLTTTEIQLASGLQIVAPVEDQPVDAGSKLTVIVKPGPGENWEEVILGLFPMSSGILTNDYSTTISLPPDLLGYHDLFVLAYDKAGNKTKLRRRVFVKLPTSVVLQGIVAGYSGLDFVSLRKLPAGSDALDTERSETRQLSTYGEYTDGVNRELTSSTSGTTYASSDENVATVSPEGKIIAQGLGNATITVRNGKYTSTVKVVVKPYGK